MCIVTRLNQRRRASAYIAERRVGYFRKHRKRTETHDGILLRLCRQGAVPIPSMKRMVGRLCTMFVEEASVGVEMVYAKLSEPAGVSTSMVGREQG